MENVEDSRIDNISVDASHSAVNNLILDYYKKVGRKRDLEQFFSLSTAPSEIRDPAGTFWRNMKSQSDSSDSGEKKSESSTELCRISIKCSVPEPSNLQVIPRRHFREHEKSDSESPPIITDEGAPGNSRDSEEESVKSYDIQSQKSNDATLDTSMNKPHSPTSSITSQRKLEWDSLADVGYANESDRKTSASSLSTLERMALQQQYSHDSRQNLELGPPTSHSTPLEETETKSKGKKGLIKKTTKIYQKDVDLVELNVPHSSQANLPQSISVNLSKHISFNVEKDGEINIDNIKKNISVSPEKSFETETHVQEKLDKEIQTTLIHNKDKSTELTNTLNNVSLTAQKFPVLISLNTLKNRNRKKKLRIARKKLRNKSKLKVDRENISQEKGTEPISEAESFEYMPGHIYNQNHMKISQSKEANVGNKSSLESSAGLTTDSSKGSKHSFTKDLEKSIDLLKAVLQQHEGDSTLKKKLIKEVVQRLIKSNYRDDGSSSDFLSGLSFNSKITGLKEGNHTTTSSSDANNTEEKHKLNKPKKSILRADKFNSNDVASTSQSAPNLRAFSYSEKLIPSNLTKSAFSSNTDSDKSSKEKNSSDIGMTRTSSEELYRKYLEALRREEAYKKHLKNKDNFLKQKLVSSETAISQIAQADLKTRSKLKSLLKDLTRNNYNDGSGDASKLEGHTNSNIYTDPYVFPNKQRSHSVFTLSSGNSDGQNKNVGMKSRIQNAIQTSKAGCSKTDHHYCCCPFHTDHAKVGVTDSSVQVNFMCDSPVEKRKIQSDFPTYTPCIRCAKESPRNVAEIVSSSETGELKYVCLCTDENKMSGCGPENFLLYKCSRLVNKSVQLGNSITKNSNTDSNKCGKDDVCKCKEKSLNTQDAETNILKEQFTPDALGVNKKSSSSSNSSNNIPLTQNSKSSQTNVNLNLMLQRKSSVKSVSSQSSDQDQKSKRDTRYGNKSPKSFIREAVRSVQTEISINPKLSDPSISDINIIDDNECVKLISEQYKEISSTNAENNTDEHTNEKVFQSSNDKSIKDTSIQAGEIDIKEKLTVDSSCVEHLDKEVQSNTEPVDNDQNVNFSDQFTIPIRGTNMTLKVNLGTKKPDYIESKQPAMNSQGVGTESMNVVEEFTSLREDCTKSVQCNDDNILQPTNQYDIEDNKRSKINDKQKTVPLNKSTVNTCCGIIPKYNTYPKEDQVNTRKPLFRTNTDISKFENLDTLHIDLIKDKTIKQCQFSNYKNKNGNDIPKTIFEQQLKCKSQIQSQPDSSSASSSTKCCKGEVTKMEESKSRTQSPIRETDNLPEVDANKDPLLDLIQGITKRYSKNDVEGSKRKKCFKEIMTLLNYLLDTDDSTDEQNKTSSNNACNSSCFKKADVPEKDGACIETCSTKTFVDKGVQLTKKRSKSNKCPTESSEIPTSTDFPTTSTDSATCKVINKIKKECEKYHQKRCKSHNGLKTCETSSTTSANCDKCKQVHHCCLRHKCRPQKSKTDKSKKKCIAYNLILQTSDSVMSEDVAEAIPRPLKSIIVKVPSKRKQNENIPFKEMSAKLERNIPNCCPRSPIRGQRSRSLPNESEISSTEEFFKKAHTYTVREYLERNRPDFVEKSAKRQDCLKVINETRASERDAKRKLLSLQLDRQQTLSALTDKELHQFAKQLCEELRRKKVSPKFISEREMKRHSEKIYKSLPEVIRKKEELKKENIKKTNLLMANIFKKNLQKKTLRGSVSLSNYSPVIKI
ncbi:uncharacterized protein [Epargyreus clarus]|uniref:uncharacterized protein n=1 Tax=Epargyreus clarus TaxID=520877 RepID=UPI003C2CEF54